MSEHTLGSGDDSDVAWLGAHVEDDWLLHNRNQEVGAFAVHVWQNSVAEQVEDNGAVSRVDCVTTRRGIGQMRARISCLVEAEI